MYKSYVPYLQHILDECLYVRSVIKDDMQREEFLRDETLKRAVTRSLSIIGEATKKSDCVFNTTFIIGDTTLTEINVYNAWPNMLDDNSVDIVYDWVELIGD
jgi:hypothetical protein